MGEHPSTNIAEALEEKFNALSKKMKEQSIGKNIEDLSQEVKNLAKEQGD